MKSFKKGLTLSICFIMVFSLFTGCGKKQNDTETNTKTGTQTVLPGMDNDLTMVVAGDVDNTKTLTTLVDLDLSPAFNGNPYDAAGLNWSVQPLIYDYLAFYTPYPERTFKPSIVESFDFTDTTLVFKILPGLKWSDGTVLDATDVMTQFYVSVGRNTIWNYVVSIEQVDELTIKIVYCTESPLVLNVTLNTPVMTPNEIFGEWADKYKDIVENNRTFDDVTNMYRFSEAGNEKLTIVNEELLAYKPKANEAVFSGQYVVDKFNTSEILFVPNKNYRKTPLISSIRGLRPGDAQSFSTALLAGEYTMENGGLNIDMSTQVDKKYKETMRKIYIPELSSIGYTLNVNNYPLNIPEVRKAISSATDRQTLIAISEPGSFLGDTTNSPLLPSLHGSYTTEGFTATLQDHGYNLDKAKELLTSIGWKKEGNKWVDEKGVAPVITIATINSWPSFMMTAEAMSSMLTDFGFNIEFKPMEFGVWNDFTKSSDKMISCVFLGGAASYAHPWETYSNLFTNIRAGWPIVEPGKDIILIAPTTGKEYNVTTMLNDLYTETDPEETKKITEEFMILANDLSGYIPVIEKAAPLRIYDTKLSLADAELNAVQQSYYYYGNINTVIAKLLKDDLIFFVK